MSVATTTMTMTTHICVARAEKLFDGLYILVRWYMLTPHNDGELAVVGRHPLSDVVVG